MSPKNVTQELQKNIKFVIIKEKKNCFPSNSEFSLINLKQIFNNKYSIKTQSKMQRKKGKGEKRGKKFFRIEWKIVNSRSPVNSFNLASI